jgi:starch-binding outer membrane protein, SusD/RagB family
MSMKLTWLPRAACAALLLCNACNVLDVESPGKIIDENLNNPDAIPGIVAGMSYDVTRAVNSINYLVALGSGELFHAGSYSITDIARGIILPEDVNTDWSRLVKPGWSTEHGLERIKTILEPQLFAKNPYVARAYLLAGFAHRTIAENACETVINGGAPQPTTVELDLGITAFTNAITVGTAADEDAIVTAAHAGRASLRAWKNNWSGAVDDAVLVPADFEYDAALMTEGYTEGSGNDLAYETHVRFEYSVYNTEFANHYGDPRIPWDTAYKKDMKTVAVGANGATPVYRQNKYVEIGDDIPLTKGTEMLVLRAEAALRTGDIATAYARMNEARAFYKMSPLPVATTPAQAWADLRYERGATVWLESRRLWDQKRWFAADVTSPEHSDFLRGRDSCIPISRDERLANPNIP